MANKEWEFVGKGDDHIVYCSPYNPQRLIKVPRFLNTLTMILTGMNATHIQNELDFAKKLVEGSSIRIPDTRIVARRFNYIMFQDKKIEDESVVEAAELIEAQGIQLITDKYYETPENFIVCDGFIYWIDSTHGTVSRTLNRFNILPYEKVVHFRVSLKRLWRDKFHINF